MTTKPIVGHAMILAGDCFVRIGILTMCFGVITGGCASEVTHEDVAANISALDDSSTWVADDEDVASVRTSVGKVRGKVVGNTREFLGIPYAQPPVRFAPAQPVAPWTGVRDALAFGPVCPQPAGALSAPGPQSEDCLTLNVFTPLDAKKEKAHRTGLPVMVFIHGGAFISGGSTQYDSQKLSEAGHVVVVTLNYRLGSLGFLSHPALDASRPANAPSGNDALRDQQLALRWVQDNIGPFGGSADQVTIFGESAGSMSVCLQMVSPTAGDLGQQFIMESAACVGGLPVVSKASADALGTAMGNELCPGAADPIACLRAKPVSDLLGWRANAGISGAGWAPVYNPNDPLLPAKPAAIIASGNYNKGPFITGTNKNEWGLFQLAGLSPSITTIAQFQAAVSAQFGPLAPAVLQQYPVNSDAEANGVFITLMTDAVFRCPTRRLARLATAQGSQVHLYSFEEGLAYHAMEIPYVFGNPSPILAPMLIESLRSTVQSYWTSFAIDGDPNTTGQPTWPLYDSASDQHMTLKASSVVGAGLSQAQCNFWDYVATLTP